MLIPNWENRYAEEECHFFHQKSHIYWPRIDTRPLQGETGF